MSFKDWMKDRKQLSVLAIEKRVGMPQGTLNKYLKGSRGLPEKYIKPLKTLMSNYGFNGIFD